MMTRVGVRWLGILLWVASFVPLTLAQNPRGTLRGTVQDASCGRVPNAKIIVHNAELSFAREAQSDDRGEFRIEDLPPASYDVLVTASMLADAHAEISLDLAFIPLCQNHFR